MGFFSFFKKRKVSAAGRQSMSPPDVLKQVQEDIPELHKASQYFKEYEVSLQHHEWGLALENLVDMADESGHYFPAHFWEDLIYCAEKMGMQEKATYCRQQITRNGQELPDRDLPRGWSMVKIDENTYPAYIAKKYTDGWTTTRRRKDKLDKMLQKDGFYMRAQGRYGMIYYIDNGKVLEIDWEISGVPKYDILLSFDDLTTWSIPENLSITPEDKAVIRLQFQEWLKKKKIRADLPENPPEQ